MKKLQFEAKIGDKVAYTQQSGDYLFVGIVESLGNWKCNTSAIQIRTEHGRLINRTQQRYVKVAS